MTETEHTAAAMDVCETDDREAAIPEFLEWLKQHGVKHPKIGFLRQGANNLSLLATDDIHVCFHSIHTQTQTRCSFSKTNNKQISLNSHETEWR